MSFYNMFVDLATGRSPYDTFRDLMHFERSFFLLGANGTLYRQVFSTPFFEYYAYPPLPFLIYYLPAKLCQFLAPLHYRFANHPNPLRLRKTGLFMPALSVCQRKAFKRASEAIS